MRITSQEEYGLRCILQLAHRPQSELVSVKEIAKGEGLSTAYVEKLLRLLARGGLVHSVRGVKGGYVMNRAPAQVTLGDVIRSLGTVQTTENICSSFTGNEDECVHFNGCSIRSVWSGLTSYIQRFMNETTVADLLEDEYAVSTRLAERAANGSDRSRNRS